MTIDDFIRESIRENESEVKAMIMQKKQERISELLDYSGLGKRFRDKRFDDYVVRGENREAFDKAVEFSKRFPNCPRGLLISGPVGTGKSRLAAAITNSLIDRLYTVICRDITDIVSLIKSTYGKKTDLEERELVNMLTDDVDLLVIDDLGKEQSTENTLVLLYQIVNRLYCDQKPVVITTNYTGQALVGKLGERGSSIVSRLTEMCDAVAISGKDWRLTND